ncbi:MAG: hypothetical protein ACTSYV_03140 [Candidatus Heimdallarchaeaceae archaeon]
MVSEVIKRELRLANERLRIAIIILLFWVVIMTLDINGIIHLATNETHFLVYAIMSATAVIFLILGLGIQVEPIVKEMIKNRKDINSFWERKEELKPSISKRIKISEICQLFAITLLMIALLFISL